MLKINVFAKINRSLKIKALTENGYHLLESEMTSVSIADVICVQESNRDFVMMDNRECGSENTAMRALTVMRKRAEFPALRIDIEKHIPVAAGLGGSSADAAGVLIALHKLYGIALNDADAACIGSDVPFMLHGGRANVKGLGEIIEPLPYKKEYFLVVKPQGGVSTKECYALYDKLGGEGENELQRAAIALCPEIETLLIKMRELSGECAMTGSGSGVYGIFFSEQEALSAQKYFKEKTYLCVSKPQGYEIMEMN